MPDARPAPLAVRDRTAADMLDMPVTRFRKYVADGALPPPERIALDWSEGAAVTRGPLFEIRTRWVREDVAQAMVEAALHEVKASFTEGDICEQIDEHTPADARAALDRLIAEAVEAEREALRDAVLLAPLADGSSSVTLVGDEARGFAMGICAAEAAIRARKSPPSGDG